MVNLSQMQRHEIKETLREESVLSKLDNPYIIKYHESFINEDNLCIITEYCQVRFSCSQFYTSASSDEVRKTREVI